MKREAVEVLHAPFTLSTLAALWAATLSHPLNLVGRRRRGERPGGREPGHPQKPAHQRGIGEEGGRCRRSSTTHKRRRAARTQADTHACRDRG